MIIFTEKNDAQPEMKWYHYLWNYYVWETDYSAGIPADLLSNGPRRGKAHNPLFIFNHFLTGKNGGSCKFADQINYNPFLINRVTNWICRAGQIPNFITVDFYNRGDLFNVVQQLNSINGSFDNVITNDNGIAPKVMTAELSISNVLYLKN